MTEPTTEQVAEAICNALVLCAECREEATWQEAEKVAAAVQALYAPVLAELREALAESEAQHRAEFERSSRLRAQVRRVEQMADDLHAQDWGSLTLLAWRVEEDLRAALAGPDGKGEQCSTCDGTGRVDWAPGQIRDLEDDQQPCPDCEGPTDD